MSARLTALILLSDGQISFVRLHINQGPNFDKIGDLVDRFRVYFYNSCGTIFPILLLLS